jgi:hypothetical protein
MENLYRFLDIHVDQIAGVRTLVDGAPTKSPEFKKTVQFLLLSTVLYVRCMYDWFDENHWPMQFCAWAARNLFEVDSVQVIQLGSAMPRGSGMLSDCPGGSMRISLPQSVCDAVSLLACITSFSSGMLTSSRPMTPAARYFRWFYSAA